jgi:hypothetical protein
MAVSGMTINTQVGTGLQGFTFDSPVISHGVLNTAVTGGASMTVAGFNFAPSDFSATVMAGAAMCKSTKWTSMTSLLCQSGYIHDQSVHVTISEATIGTGLAIFTFEAPVISHVALNTPWSGGGLLTLAGLNFAVRDASGSARVASGACSTVMWTSPSAISCKAGTAIGAESVLLDLTLSYIVGTGQAELISFDAPVVSSSWLNAVRSGGASLTITGLGFGTADYSSTVTTSGSLCDNVSWTSSTTVACESGTEYTQSPGASMTISSFQGTGIDTFSFDAPVASFVIRNTPLSGDAPLAFHGLNFGEYAHTITASLAGQPCKSTSWTSLTVLKCSSPAPSFAFGLSEVTVAQTLGSAQSQYSFDGTSLLLSSVICEP